jgi:hypothetical protein
MPLAPIWEVWNWSDSEFTLFGVLLMLYGAYGLGFAQGRYPDDRGDFDVLPNWVKVAMVAAVIGIVIVLAANAVDYAPGECDRPGP